MNTYKMYLQKKKKTPKPFNTKPMIANCKNLNNNNTALIVLKQLIN